MEQQPQQPAEDEQQRFKTLGVRVDEELHAQLTFIAQLNGNTIADEIRRSIESPEVQRYPLQLEWCINQYFEIDRYQPLLFIVDSFGHLFDLVGELERWMRAGKLNNVAPGEPHISEADIKSFLHASLGK